MISSKEFSLLDKKEKIWYLKQIVEVFENSENLLGNLAKLIQAIPEEGLTDELLDITYKIIFDTVKIQNDKIKQQELEKLQKINKKIKAIKQKEMKEKFEADKLLENL